MDQPIDILITDSTRRDFLGERLHVRAHRQCYWMSEWLERSALPEPMARPLLDLFIDPRRRSAAAFDGASIPAIIEYIRLSHRFYNKYYLQALDQVSERLVPGIESPGRSMRLTCLTRRFNGLFRAHLLEEECRSLPYIAYLEWCRQQDDFDLPGYYAMMNRCSLDISHDHESEQYELLDEILGMIMTCCSRYRYDFLWERYRRLLTEFRLDLSIHEFIEDEVLLPRAKCIEAHLDGEVVRRSALN